jgi:hypothetical protein
MAEPVVPSSEMGRHLDGGGGSSLERGREGEESGNGCGGGRGVLGAFIGAQGGLCGRWSTKGVEAVDIYGR